MNDPQPRDGLQLAALAFTTWGVAPLFWRLLTGIPAAEQLLHRIFWAAVFMLGLLAVRGRFDEFRAALADRRSRRWLMASAVLLGANWFVFLVAVASERVLHASLGYYLNPLLSVVLGMIFLGERLRRMQWIAVGCATAGVAVMVARVGEFPWIGLALALAFGFYGLLRKRVEVEPLPGSAVETTMLAVPCLIGIGVVELWFGTGHFTADLRSGVLLWSAGIFTALPILWFTGAAKRLPLFAIGFMQYIAPTAQFLLAVLVFGETFTPAHGVAFALIWLGVALFATDLLMVRRLRMALPAR